MKLSIPNYSTNIQFDKLEKGKRYTFQRKRISEQLCEKLFSANFEELLIVNGAKRILLSNYLDKDNNNPLSKVSMPITLIEYIINNQSFNITCSSTNYINKKNNYNNEKKPIKDNVITGSFTNNNGYNEYYEENTNTNEEDYEYYGYSYIDTYHDSNKITDSNKENRILSEMERFIIFFEK
jgi:hypothetical protein